MSLGVIILDLHYLEIFYEVAKAKSFTKAAEKLFINQSAVSIQVKKFEDILKVKLFDRSSKKIKLTYIGETLYKMAEDIFEKVKRAEKEISRVIEVDRARIAIGASSIIAEPLLPSLMKDFSSAHEEIEYNVTISNKEHLLKLLKEGELDVIIIDSQHITDSNLEIVSIEKGPYVLISSQAYLNVEDIEKDPIITRNTIPNNNKAIEVIEDRYGINFSTKINVVGNLEVIKGMVREGVGNVILPYYAVYKDIKKGDFKVISKVDEVKDGYELIITKDKKDLSQITKFINIVKNHKIVMESTRH
ncbi:LysR family transcriptional regulator [Fusobacterium nucleatum subsp. nucleatum ATCC 23726]|uniref:LysR family transcriptional regulator n=2 Tax=Fusobacterium nucleatum subsp. nucleatum TaxID=76856 RepID=Q8RG17_FUSNN|nr:LysR family transcriptional regulator [Fusobacterium nucleatum]AAL94699.1 Transcriptional regulatory protein, LYSR family [Fusobacterium nucleatum subsp. nucleatum ATCC 25586]AVQ14950.1 LysR family transcriptional regulator [Fusobacterium nucleatum subsp. nucleatum ATCC 25586]AVQ23781.1 LysR family transcriptional regulator [Fusobacterium nucleatum subsp. nucleatum ATCC 23726]EFG94866.1 transcriptional regulator, LysR family [Fusobacterium nucleatum subsp. nucleatum ATCC 23726]WMS29812.1 Ly